MKTKLLLSILLSFIFYLLSSQVPQGFNYQAIARDGSGNPIVNGTIKVKLSIMSGDTTGFYSTGIIPGTYIWEEVQTNVKTNGFGLFTVVFGNPSASKAQGTSSSFSAIDWAKGPLYIGTKIANPDDYKILGAAQLWSVPYSMVTDSTKALLKGSRLSVVEPDAGTADALFEVKRKDGQTVFAVYPTAVNIYVPRTAKGTKGGFAIGGFETAKDGLPPQDYFRVTPDSVRIYIDKSPVVPPGKGATKGGFAIGGFDQAKNKTLQDLFTVSNDSIRMYLDLNPTPGKGATKGGFAIGGFDQVKGGVPEINFLNVSTVADRVINPSQNRMLWYPVKNSFLVGKVLIEHPDSVGINSFATGFESKAVGQYSQAFGYGSVAQGNYSTSIGYGNRAKGDYSLALGYNNLASGVTSITIGIGCKATGQNSFAFGYLSQALGDYAYAIGFKNKSLGGPSYAFGDQAQSLKWGSTSMGWLTKADAEHSMTIGDHTISKNVSSLVLGRANDTTAFHTDSWNVWHDDDPVLVVGNGLIGYAPPPINDYVAFTRSNSFSILKNGKTGINMNYPTYMLDVNGEIASRNGDALRFRNNDYSTLVHQDGTDLYLLVTNYGYPDGSWNSFRPFKLNYSSGNVYIGSNDNGTNFSLAVQSNGRVGVGTANPQYSLDVKGRARIISNGETAGHWLTTAVGTDRAFIGMDGDDYVGFYGSGAVGWGLNMNCDNGCVGIGVAIPTFRLQLPNDPGQSVGRAQAYEWATYSDARIKTDQKEIPYGLDEIMKIKPKIYSHHSSEFKSGIIVQGPGTVSIGVFAQELYSIIPEAVDKPDDETNTLWSIDYNKLVPVLIRGMQEQQERIESDKSEITNLKAQLQTIQQKVEQIEALLAKSVVK
jgi:hypothetical protein